jgi:arylsulfatase A-like enzyme
MDSQDLPNIVFILADDIGYGDVGCYNPDCKIPTPHIDRLAGEGVMFTDAHSPSAVCTPTRYGVLTGCYCWRSALKYSVLFGYEPPLIEPQRLTVARMLKQAGYHTACIGKWHLGLGYTAKPGEHVDFDRPLPWPNADRAFELKIDFTQPLTGGPLDLGFDHFYGTSGCPTCQPPYGFIENDRFVQVPSVYHDDPVYTSRPGMMVPGWDHKDADPIICQKAVEYIESRADDDSPFFLYLAPSAVHEPCTDEVVPEFARGKSRAGPRGDLAWLFDWMVGRVMDALARTGKAENTLVWVTSDNGALPGDRIRDENGQEVYRTYAHKSCGDWRGWKSHIWDGGHREPLVVSWPGVIAPGTVTDELTCLTDFMATCAALVGYALPEDAAEDSYDILPVLLGETLDVPIREALVHHSGFGVFSIRQGPWKLIVDTLGSGGWPPPRGTRPQPGTPGQLYHLGRDPQETDNLWAERPDIVARLSTLLERYKQEGASVSRST